MAVLNAYISMGLASRLHDIVEGVRLPVSCLRDSKGHATTCMYRLAGGTRHVATLLTKEVQLFVTHDNAANVFTAECHMAHAVMIEALACS